MNKAPSILIILTGSLGDVARALALPAAIKQKWPNADICWLIDSYWYEFIALNKYIDRFIVFDRKQPLISFLSTIKKIKSTKFDYCLDLQRILKSGIFSWFSYASKRIGFAKANSKELNFLFNNFFIPEVNEEKVAKFDQYIAFLETLDIRISERFDFGISDNVAKVDLNQLGTAKLREPIAIILSSSWESKNWTVKGYAELLQKLIATTSSSLLLIGAKKDDLLAQELMLICDSSRVVNLAGKTTLPQLAALINCCKLCIGPDSGPGHIAAALGVPVVTIFGPTIPARVAPYRNLENAISIAVDCGPCLRRKCPGFGNICTHNISADMVLKQALAVLKA